MSNVVPINMKKKMGNPGCRRLPEEIKAPEASKLDPPAFLDVYAVEEWNRLIDSFMAMGLLSEWDLNNFAGMCEAYSDWRHTSDEMNKIRRGEYSMNDAEENPDGVPMSDMLKSMIKITHTGIQMQQALIGIKNVARDKYLTLSKEFGMTPAARTRMVMGSDRPKESKFKGLIGSKKK